MLQELESLEVSSDQRAASMAARYLSLFQRGCRRNCSIIVEPPFRGSHCKSLTSGAASGNLMKEEEEGCSKDNDDLMSRIFRLRVPKRSATNVLQRWIGDGNLVRASELRHISKELRKSQRYKHALEISEWMVTHEEFKLSDSDHAVRIDLMTKVFGIDAAERYFQALPLSSKTSETYTALLHSYAAAKMTEKAEAFYESIKESNISFNALTYNEMMTMYMSIGQPEKVYSVIEELKQQKVSPDLFTYNLWISSCASTMDIDGVRKILHEMGCDSGCNEGWLRYINLTNIYVRLGHLVNSEPNSLVEANKGIITQREWITYDFLIILQAGMGNKDRIDQIWKSLRLTSQKMTSRNYVCVLSSYLILGQLKEVGDIIDQWKQSTAMNFDLGICNKLLDAFSEIGLVDKAEAFSTVLSQKTCDSIDESK